MENITAKEAHDILAKLIRERKALEKGQDALDVLLGLEQKEAEVIQRISFLEMKENELLERNDSIDQMFIAAEDKAKQIVSSAQGSAMKIEADANTAMAAHKEKVIAAQKQLDDINALVDIARVVHQQIEDQIGKRKAELSELDRAKENARVALGL